MPLNATLTILMFLRLASEQAMQMRTAYTSKAGILSSSMALPVSADAMTHLTKKEPVSGRNTHLQEIIHDVMVGLESRERKDREIEQEHK